MFAESGCFMKIINPTRATVKRCVNTLVIYSLAILLLSSCAAPPDKVNVGPVFYPPLPNSPRIQFLTSFATLRDLTDTSVFSDFLLGKERTSQSLVKKPYGVALADGKLFAVDTRGPGYVVFDLKQQRTYSISGLGAGRMKKPINIVLDAKGNRFVTDTERNQVLMFNNQDEFVRAFGLEGQFKPTDVALLNDEMYVVDIEHHKIQVLSIAFGDKLREFGKAGSNENEFYHPTNIKIGVDGNLYISDTGNYRIQVYSRKGKFIRSIGKAGSGIGEFARPKGLALDRSGHVYVVDAAFNNVQIFGTDGKLLLFFGGAGNEPGGLNLPTDIEIDYDNVKLFQKYAAPGFELEFVILVANQFGPNKISAYGYGRMKGMSYE